MFVFIVVVWIFFFNKYMIQNPVFFVYNVIMLSIVYAIVLSQAAQAHASRKKQRLIHERVMRCVTRCSVTREFENFQNITSDHKSRNARAG